MTERIAIGIDGGGTKTRVIEKKSLQGELLYDRKFPSTNYNNIGEEELKKVLTDIYSDLLEIFGHEELKSASLVMGSAGIDRPQDAEVYINAMKSCGFECSFQVCNDSYIALIGGNGGRNGALLITGTGSIATGISLEGNEVRTGGWGAMISDDGSGYKIGIKAISAVMDHYDGMIDNTALTHRLLKHYGINSPEDFMDLVYMDKNFNVEKVASVAPIVQEEAMKGDAAALNILKAEVERLKEMIRALSLKMNQKEFRLSLAGSLMLKSEIYLKLFKDKIKESLPGVQICEPLYDPVYGALILALER